MTTLAIDIDRTERLFDPEVVVVAGYTGADAAAVQHHVDELAVEGIAPPPRIPMYWAMPASSLSQAPVIEVPSNRTSGEVELALIIDGDEIFVTLASDHTDRQAEAIDIGLSKMICPTPIGQTAWRWESVSDRWADLLLASSVSIDGAREEYQEATAGANLPPADLLAGIPWETEAPSCFVLLCGTVPTIGGIRPADDFHATATDLTTDRSLFLSYEIRSIPGLAMDD